MQEKQTGREARPPDAKESSLLHLSRPSKVLQLLQVLAVLLSLSLAVYFSHLAMLPSVHFPFVLRASVKCLCTQSWEADVGVASRARLILVVGMERK